MPCLFILFYQTFHSLSQACKNFQILSEKRSVSQSKSGCCSYDNHSVIVFSLMISQSKICFYSIDQSNLLFCFSLPLTFLSTELSLFLRKVCLQYFFLRRMLKYFATLNRVLEILLFRAFITFNWNQLLPRLKKLIKELHIQPPFKFSLTNHFWSYWTSKKFRPSLITNCFRFCVFLFVTKKTSFGRQIIPAMG